MWCQGELLFLSNRQELEAIAQDMTEYTTVAGEVKTKYSREPNQH